MPHTSTYIYRDPSATPVQGVTMDDINAVIGGGSTDLGILCQSDSIKPWAKFKPVKRNTHLMTGRTSINQGETDPYWKADDGKCGFAFTVYTDVGSRSSGLVGACASNNVLWGRQKPTAAFGFRSLDFDGYDHQAVSPIGPLPSLDLMLDSNGNLNVNFDNIVPPNPELNLKYSDFVIDNIQLSNFKFGIVLLHKTNNNFYVLTSSNTLGSDNYTISTPFPSAYVGEYYLIPCFFYMEGNPYTMTNQVFVTGKYLTANLPRYEVTISSHTGSVTAEATAQWISSAHVAVNWEVLFTNTSSSPFTYDNLSVMVYESDTLEHPEQGAFIPPENRLTEFTVPAKQGTTPGTYTANGTITLQWPTGRAYNPAKFYFVKINFAYNNYIQIEEYDEPLAD